MSGKRSLVLVLTLSLILVTVAVQCGPTPTPEVIEKVVKETVVVEKEVVVTSTPEPEVIEEVEAAPVREARPTPAPPVLVYGGGPFEDPRVQEAVLHAVPWKELTEQIFPDRDVPVAVELWEEGPMLDDAREVPYDPDRARELLAEAGFPDGFVLLLLLTPDDEPLADMTRLIAEELQNVNIKVEFIEALAHNTHYVVAETIAIGDAVLWLRFCPSNPPLNTAITAHGNTDWHIDTAEEFLFGTDMGGTTTAANHCPASWTRRHMNVGLSNTDHFYYDADLTTPGDDTDGTSGIETAMLFFHAGHGFPPPEWDTLGNKATQSNMSLGDCPGGGLLRYYWQCSCTTFAHGPRCCPGMNCHPTHPCPDTGGYDWWYQCPGDFDGSADSVNMRNIYERWGPVLNPPFRMACGSSTCAYCHESQMNRIWNNYNNNGYDVADSFIDGLRGSSGVVPLCITMGGSDVTATPLYDATFTNQPNTSGTSYYHVQYLENFESTPIWPEVIIHIPELLPILAVRPVPPWYFHGELEPIVEGPILEEEEYIERARGFIEEQDWAEKNFAEPMGVRFLIETTPVKGTREERQQLQKNVIVTFKRQIDVDGTLVNVLGEGGVMKVQMNNDGSVLNASKVWREIVDVEQEARVKTYDEAYEEALEQTQAPQAYELDRWTWGYKEAAGNVEQTELRIVFRFWFVPVELNAEGLLEYPPQMVEIPGQLQ